MAVLVLVLALPTAVLGFISTRYHAGDDIGGSNNPEPEFTCCTVGLSYTPNSICYPISTTEQCIGGIIQGRWRTKNIDGITPIQELTVADLDNFGSAWEHQLLDVLYASRIGKEKYTERGEGYDCDDFARDLEIYLQDRGYDAKFVTIVEYDNTNNKFEQGHCIVGVQAPDGTVYFIEPQRTELANIFDPDRRKVFLNLDSYPRLWWNGKVGDGKVKAHVNQPFLSNFWELTEGFNQINVYDNFQGAINAGFSPDDGDMGMWETDATTGKDTGKDAGNTFEKASKPMVLSGTGVLTESLDPKVNDERDYYKIMLTAGQVIQISMTPPAYADFDLFLLDPSGITKASSTNRGQGSAESISFTAVEGGEWRVMVSNFAVGGDFNYGTYSFTITIGTEIFAVATTTSTSTSSTSSTSTTSTGTVDTTSTIDSPGFLE